MKLKKIRGYSCNWWWYLEDVADDDGHDDAIDSDRLTEDDTDEVLGPDAGHLHAGTKDARPSREYSPVDKDTIANITVHFDTVSTGKRKILVASVLD